MAAHRQTADLVEFEVGYDRFTAQAILADCETNGYRVELLTMDNAGPSPGLLALQPHRIIGEVGDGEEVQAIIRGWIPEDTIGSQPTLGRPHLVMRLAAAAMLTIIAFGLVASLFDLF